MKPVEEIKEIVPVKVLPEDYVDAQGLIDRFLKLKDKPTTFGEEARNLAEA